MSDKLTNKDPYEYVGQFVWDTHTNFLENGLEKELERIKSKYTSQSAEAVVSSEKANSFPKIFEKILNKKKPPEDPNKESGVNWSYIKAHIEKWRQNRSTGCFEDIMYLLSYPSPWPNHYLIDDILIKNDKVEFIYVDKSTDESDKLDALDEPGHRVQSSGHQTFKPAYPSAKKPKRRSLPMDSVTPSSAAEYPEVKVIIPTISHGTIVEV